MLSNNNKTPLNNDNYLWKESLVSQLVSYLKQAYMKVDFDVIHLLAQKYFNDNCNSRLNSWNISSYIRKFKSLNFVELDKNANIWCIMCDHNYIQMTNETYNPKNNSNYKNT